MYVEDFGDTLEYVYSVCCIYYLEIDSTYVPSPIVLCIV